MQTDGSRPAVHHCRGVESGDRAGEGSMRANRSSLMRSEPGEGTPPRLVAIGPPNLQGTVFELMADRVVVGRGEQSDVRVDNHTLSRTHAAVERSTGQSAVSDLHSTNGTFVNGARVGEEPRSLND